MLKKVRLIANEGLDRIFAPWLFLGWLFALGALASPMPYKIIGAILMIGWIATVAAGFAYFDRHREPGT